MPQGDLEEFQQLVPPCAVAFQAPMAMGRLDGKPRTAHPLRMEAALPHADAGRSAVLLLAHLPHTSTLQVVQGRLCGMRQRKAHQWMHVLVPTLRAAFRALGAAPARSLTALVQRGGLAETDAAAVVALLAEATAPVVTGPAAVPASPLCP